MNTQIRTGFILEDNIDAQQYLCNVLSSSFPEISIDVSSSLEEANQLLESIQPDIALVDLNLPDGSGIDLLKKLSSEMPKCISVVTTIYDDDNHLFSALRAGAQGYLLKEQRSELLIEALQGVTEGKPALTPKIALKILTHFSGNEELVPKNSSNVDDGLLTKREREVLRLIAKGYSVKNVANEINISHHTVSSHIKNIYSKLEISCRAEATKKAVQLGITD